jgi:hypothetical protein
MGIEQHWNKMDENTDSDLSALLQTGNLSKLSSHNPLQKIKRNLLINIIWGLLICAIYILIMLYFQIWQVQIAIGITFIFSVWALYTSYREYLQINTGISSNNSVLVELQRHHQSITNWMKTQQRVALFIYPVSAAGGFMLGGALGSGKPVAAFMHNPIAWVALLISVAILVPACYYLAKWMFKYGFGKHLAALQNNITALQQEK